MSVNGSDQDWRTKDAAALEEKARTIGECLRLIGDVYAILESDRDEKAATELSGTAGLLRDRAAGYVDRARQLRMARRDEPHPELPRATTTKRNPRMFVCGPDDIDESGGVA